MPRRPWVVPDDTNVVLNFWNFLATIPYVSLDDPAAQEECGVCLLPYKETQQPGEGLNRPVRLTCGHILGIQCLAHWMLSEATNGRCPYCRANLVTMSRVEVRDPVLTSALVNLEMLCAFGGQIPTSKRPALVATFEKSLTLFWGNEPPPRDQPRLKMLWGEFLDLLCEPVE